MTYRAAEVYEIRCHICHVVQEQPAEAIDSNGGKTVCVRCGTKLQINFRPEEPKP